MLDLCCYAILPLRKRRKGAERATRCRRMGVPAKPLVALYPVHTAKPDPTKQSCLRRVCLGGENWILENSRLSATENCASATVAAVTQARQAATV